MLTINDDTGAVDQVRRIMRRDVLSGPSTNQNPAINSPLLSR